VFVLFFYSSQGDDGHLFFSSRMGIEKEKIAEEKCSWHLHFYISMYARSFAPDDSIVKKNDGARKKNF
jgi:hypothetical protein